MKVYFGGCERPNTIHTLAKAGGKRVMISFAEPPTQTCWQLYREYGIEIMADSGAYSIWKRGLSLDIRGYMDWLNKHKVVRYFNMDIVGNPIQTAENQKLMESVGFLPIPVFHYGSPWSELEKLTKEYDFIGIGGTVGQPYSIKVSFFRELFSRFPDTRFHGLGFANEKLIRQFPFHSTDSIWWLWRWRDKNKKLAPGNCRKVEQTARVKQLLKLEKTERMYQQVMIY